MRMKKIEILSKDEIETIHSSTMTLLESVGIQIEDPETRKLLKSKGAETDENSAFVKFSESFIKEQLKLVPNSFKLHGPDGSFNFEVNTVATQFATIGTPVKIYDPSKKTKVRKTILEDTIQQIRVVDSLKHINCSHVDVWPNDVQFTSIHAQCIYQWSKNTRKPYGLGCYGKVASQDMMNMVSIIVGGEEELIKKPRLVGFVNPTSPLQLPQIMTNGLQIFAKYKQPTIIAPEALAGSTAPVTLAGLLVQTNAEIIGGIILAQIYDPKSPVFFGTVSCVTDMRSGNTGLGALETGLITTGIAQLARFYKIPSRGVGGVTDSKCLDIQNGIERLQTLLLAAQAGINYITCAGTYESTLTEALELLVIDDELVGIVKRALEGITVNDETIALDVIKKIATSTEKGVSFLGEIHTLKHMKKELYIPKLMDRKRRTRWRKEGSRDLIEIAKEKIDEIIKSYIPPELPSDVDQKLQEYLKKVEKRTIEEYKKAEGITTAAAPVAEIDFEIQ
ncbi:MAG: trimethylamine methyltransferase family protein [Candidatus Helarchaeota archaeon]|nr:trimethylamine methyltransferase family protein [Candidatus Helarchaeota archaeon]